MPTKSKNNLFEFELKKSNSPPHTNLRLNLRRWSPHFAKMIMYNKFLQFSQFE